MKTRTDRHGTPLCLKCGVAAPDVIAHMVTGCQPSDILTESIRKVIARAMAQRLGADVASSLTLQAVAEFLTAHGLSIVDEHLNIVEVL
jgi:hypothetical protein